MAQIINGKNIPLNAQAGTVPDVSGALQNYFQPMVFSLLKKTISGFQVVEDAAPLSFMGVIQPFTTRQLLLKPEGERAWSWVLLHCEPGVVLRVDDVAQYLGRQYRVMAQTNYRLYGYIEYHLVEDWVGAGP